MQATLFCTRAGRVRHPLHYGDHIQSGNPRIGPGRQVGTTEYLDQHGLNTTSEWLAMSVEQRLNAFKTEIRPAIQKQGDDIRLCFYDTEFYSARVTDIWVWEARSHKAYQLLIDALRETPFWDRYFEIVKSPKRLGTARHD